MNAACRRFAAAIIRAAAAHPCGWPVCGVAAFFRMPMARRLLNCCPPAGRIARLRRTTQEPHMSTSESGTVAHDAGEVEFRRPSVWVS